MATFLINFSDITQQNILEANIPIVLDSVKEEFFIIVNNNSNLYNAKIDDTIVIQNIKFKIDTTTTTYATLTLKVTGVEESSNIKKIIVSFPIYAFENLENIVDYALNTPIINTRADVIQNNLTPPLPRFIPFYMSTIGATTINTVNNNNNYDNLENTTFNEITSYNGCSYGSVITNINNIYAHTTGIIMPRYSTFINYENYINTLQGITYSSLCFNTNYFNNNIKSVTLSYNNNSPNNNYDYTTGNANTCYNVLIHSYQIQGNEIGVISNNNLQENIKTIIANDSGNNTSIIDIRKIEKKPIEIFNYEEVKISYNSIATNNVCNIKLPFSIWGYYLSLNCISAETSNWAYKVKFASVLANNINNSFEKMTGILKINNIDSVALGAPIGIGKIIANNITFWGQLPINNELAITCVVLNKKANNLFIKFALSGNFFGNSSITGSLGNDIRTVNTSVLQTTLGNYCDIKYNPYTGSSLSLYNFPAGTYYLPSNCWLVSEADPLAQYRNTVDIVITTYKYNNCIYQEVLGVNKPLLANRYNNGQFNVIISPCLSTNLSTNDEALINYNDNMSIDSNSNLKKVNITDDFSIVYGLCKTFDTYNVCRITPTIFLCYQNTLYPLTTNINNLFWNINWPLNSINNNYDFGYNVRFCSDLNGLCGETGKGIVIGPNDAELLGDIMAEKIIILNNTNLYTNGSRIITKKLITGNNVCIWSNKNCLGFSHLRNPFFGNPIVWGVGISNTTGYSEISCYFYYPNDRYIGYLSGIALNKLCIVNNAEIMENICGPRNCCYCNRVGYAIPNLSFFINPQIYVPNVGCTGNYYFTIPSSSIKIGVCQASKSINFIYPRPIYIMAEKIELLGNTQIFVNNTLYPNDSTNIVYFYYVSGYNFYGYHYGWVSNPFFLITNRVKNSNYLSINTTPAINIYDTFSTMINWCYPNTCTNVIPSLVFFVKI